MFARLYIFNLWCTKKGTNAEELQEVITAVQHNIENNGYIPDLTELMKSIGYICKKIVAFWTRYDRKKSSVLQFQCDWLNQKESILLKCTHNKYQQMVESAHRGRPKLDFAESSARTKRRRIAQLTKIDESAVSALRNEHQMQNVFPADPNEVISLLMETDMSKNQYLLIRNFVNSQISLDLFPSYQSILN